MSEAAPGWRRFLAATVSVSTAVALAGCQFTRSKNAGESEDDGGPGDDHHPGRSLP